MYTKNQADTNTSVAGDFNVLKSALKRSLLELNRIHVHKEDLEKVVTYYANRVLTYGDLFLYFERTFICVSSWTQVTSIIIVFAGSE